MSKKVLASFALPLYDDAMLRYERYRETYEPHIYHFTVKCGGGTPIEGCGETRVIDVPGEELFAYQSGQKHIQDAMPSVSAADRDQLAQSHLCPKCFDEVFKEKE